MKNMKGFTLIELLAVIVILAIVALVTTPVILNVINDSRLSGAQDKAWGTIDAVKLSYTQAQSNGTDTDFNGTVTFPAGTIGTAKVAFSGDKPTGGTVHINLTDGTITCEDLTFTGNGTYHCTSNTDGTAMCCRKGEKPTEGTKAQCGKDYNGGTLFTTE